MHRFAPAIALAFTVAATRLSTTIRVKYTVATGSAPCNTSNTAQAMVQGRDALHTRPSACGR